MKTCFKCEQAKPLSDFYKHPKMLDGHFNKCKACAKADTVKHRAENDHVRAYDRERAKRPERVAKTVANTARWRNDKPEAVSAHNKVARAIKSGRLVKQPCRVCGTMDNLHAHHHDYSKPLDVEWLCALHHHRHHASE